MKKFHYILLSLGALTSAFGMQARELSGEEALSRALLSARETKTAFHASQKASSLSLAYTAKAVNAATEAFYVFDKGNDGGFIVVSADDRLPAILGYTDSGNFSYSDLPENMRWWLGEYQKEIDAYLSSQASALQAVSAPRKAADMAAISPMVTSKWNQEAPYYNDCPMDGSYRSVTGCAATAIAQIINYHKYPDKGTGSHSYQWNGRTLSFDYAATTFDWNNMLDEYNSSSPSAARAAVAKLMYACGVGLNMKYSYSGSGAIDAAVPRLLVENMGYDAGVWIAQRDSYPLSEWQSLVYGELEAGRPVFYTGQATQGGHAFVCDGYSGNGYFHINWGWGGVSDGDFRLSALNPDEQGAGSFEGGYNSSQSAVIGIRPNAGGGRIPSFYCEGEFTRSAIGTFTLTKIYNQSYFDVSGTIGILCVPESGDGQSTFAPGRSISFNACNISAGTLSGYGSTSWSSTPTGLAPGRYKVYPALRTDGGETVRLRGLNGNQQFVYLTVGADGSLSYQDAGPEVESSITVSAFAPIEKIYSGNTTSYRLVIDNSSEVEYSGAFKIVIRRGEETLMSQNYTVTVSPGGESSYTVDFAFTAAPGECEVNFYDKDGKLINATPFIITVEEGNAPVVEPGLYVMAVSPSEFYYDRPTNFVMTFKNTAAYSYNTSVYLTFYKEDGETEAFKGSFKYTFPANRTLNLTLTNLNPQLGAGTYSLALSDSEGKELSETRFEISGYQQNGVLWYGTKGDGATVVASPGGAYAGDNGILDIPATVSFDGKTYDVTAIADGALSGLTATDDIFIHSAPLPFSDASKAFEGVPAGVTVYLDGACYPEAASVFEGSGRQAYAIIEALTSEIVSGNPENLLLGEPLEISIGFETNSAARSSSEASAYVNPEIAASSSDTSVLTVEKGDFSAGTMMLTATGIKSGLADISVESAQPGEKKTLLISVSVSNVEVGVEAVVTGALCITARNGEVRVSGAEAGTEIELWNMQGVKAASAVSDGGETVLRAATGEIYLLRAGNRTAKVAL